MGINTIKRVTRRAIAWLMAVAMIAVGTFNGGVITAKADSGGVKLNFYNRNTDNGSVKYRFDGNGPWIDTDTLPKNGEKPYLTVSENDVVYLRVFPNDGYKVESASIGEGGHGVNLDATSIENLTTEAGFRYEIPAGDNDLEFELRINEVGNNPGPEPGPDGPQPPAKVPLTVSINGVLAYDGNAPEGSRITEATDYNIVENSDGIEIKPKYEVFKGNSSEKDIKENKALELGYIEAAGDGRVSIDAGLMHYIEGEDGHTEIEVPVKISANADGKSFIAYDSAELVIEWGNFRSYAEIAGTIVADRFTVNDLADLTIGSKTQPLSVAFESVNNSDDSYVEFNMAKTTIYAENAFKGYGVVKAIDEADVSIILSGADEKAFDGVKKFRVQTGGKISIESDAAINLNGSVAEAGYYNELGKIEHIPLDGRMQDYVNVVKCEIGDFSDVKGRYIYSRSADGKILTLESTTKTLYSLGYSFTPTNNEGCVENGDFEISAGSGLVRDGVTGGGEYWFEKGTEVTFKMVPNSGYQYKDKTFCFNGNNSADVVKATEDIGVYVFMMTGNPIHVTCVFEKAENSVDLTASSSVKKASIDIPQENVDMGTAALTVSDANITEEQKKTFDDVAENLTAGVMLDLTLDKVVNKVGDDEAWKESITDLKKEMSISLSLDESLAGKTDYTVIRQHDGKTEILASTYDAEKNSITFNTNGFSKYAIYYDDSSLTYIVGQKNILSKEMFDTSSLADGEEIAGYYIESKDEKKMASIKKACITAKKEGVIHVTAYKKVKDGKKTNKVAVDTIEINLVKLEMKLDIKGRYAGEQINTSKYVNNLDSVSANQTLNWKSSNKKVAEIDSKTGVITVKKAGKTTISLTLTNKDGKSVTVKHLFKVQLPKVTKKIKIGVGQEKKIQVKKLVDPENQKIEWKSENTDIVSVDAEGNIKGISKGKANVIAVIDGVEHICVVTVK